MVASQWYYARILDRVGGGEAFASGQIYTIMNDYELTDMINFVIASSVIKHTIHGDSNSTDDAAVIQDLMNQSYDIRR